MKKVISKYVFSSVPVSLISITFKPIDQLDLMETDVSMVPSLYCINGGQGRGKDARSPTVVRGDA